MLIHKLVVGNYELRNALDWNWLDEQYAAADLDPVTLSGSYSNVNLTAIFGPANGQWDISVVAKNLTDESSFSVADDIPLFPLNYGRQQSRPRSVGVGFRWRFF